MNIRNWKLKIGLAVVLGFAALAGWSQTVVRIAGARHKAQTAYATNKLVAAAWPVKLFSIVGCNVGSGDVYVCVFDWASTPTNNTTLPFVPVLVPAGQPFSFDYPGGLNYSNGVVVCVSSSRTAFTLGGNDLRAEAGFDENPY